MMMCVFSIHSPSNAVKTSACTSLFFHIHPPPQPTGNQTLSQVDFCFLFFFLNVKLLTTSFLSERQMVTQPFPPLHPAESCPPLEWHSANKPWGIGRDSTILLTHSLPRFKASSILEKWAFLVLFINSLVLEAILFICSFIFISKVPNMQNCTKLHGALGHHLLSPCCTRAAASPFLSPSSFLVCSLTLVPHSVYRQAESFPGWKGGKGTSGLRMGESS